MTTISPSKDTSENNISDRWWESYLVRYAIGTIAGAVLVYAFLNITGGDELKAKALMTPYVTSADVHTLINECNNDKSNSCVAKVKFYQDLNGFDLKQFVLLAIYGLAYCYISSVPVLVAHSVRRMIDNSFGAFIFYITFILLPLIIIFCGPIVGSSSTILFSIVFILIQVIMMVRELCKAEELTEFYMKLHSARNADKISLDSYKHLREHGNAFFIVVLEVAFFYAAKSIWNDSCDIRKYFPLLTVAWVMPGAMAYFLGHRIEVFMVKKLTGC